MRLRPPPGAWAPIDGPQLDAIRLRKTPELLFGGSRGGGKTEFLLGDFLQDVQQGSVWRGTIFRRSYPELEEVIGRSQVVVPATWPGSEWAKGEKSWYFPTGAVLRMRSLDQPEDVAKYLGHQMSWIGWDELGAFADDHAYKMMFGCLRSSEGAEAMRVRSTGNPGGAGHFWLKRRFIDPAPGGYQHIRDPDTQMLRVYIPSRVTDNKILLSRDPGYVDRLKGVGTPELVRAWLEGDWNVTLGGYFPEFGQRHIVRPFAIPRQWTRFRSFDWGSAKPFCCLWFAVADGSAGYVPKGALVAYKELYGASAPNVGLRLSAEQVADMIRDHEIGDEPVHYSVCDPACFAADGGPSIAERMAQRAVRFKPADNKRIGTLGHAAGWDLVRQRLVGEEGSPMLYFFDTCVNCIRTFPIAQHDSRRPEDMDSSGDDHALDACRYAVASRPWIASTPEPEVRLSLNFLWQQRELGYPRRW